MLSRAAPGVATPQALRVLATRTGTIAGAAHSLRIDPIAEARRHWEARWEAEPSRAMAAVTSSCAPSRS